MSPRKPKRVREPIQVYLSPEDRAMLDRVAKASGLSRAEVLRRGIRRMSAVSGEEHPALKMVRELSGMIRSDGPNDMAERHDDYLADVYLDEARNTGET